MPFYKSADTLSRFRGHPITIPRTPFHDSADTLSRFCGRPLIIRQISSAMPRKNCGLPTRTIRGFLKVSCDKYHIYIYVSALYMSRCYSCASSYRYSCASLMAAPCTEWCIALQLHSALFSGFLCSVAFLPQAYHNQSIGFCRSRHAPSPTRLCAAASLHLYKCWITLCWCTNIHLRTIFHYHC